MHQKILKPHLKTARDARVVRTREALRKALLRLLDLKPLERITIQEICKVANVGYTTYFRHHPDKESLLKEVAEKEIDQLVGLSVSILDNSGDRASCLAVCTYVDQHRKLWTTLITGGAAGAMRDEYLKLARQIAATRSRPGVWPPADIATILVVSSILELVSWWLRDSNPLTIEEIAEIMEKTIITPTASSELQASSSN